MEMSKTELAIINAYQRDFPMTSKPYARIGEKLGMSEDDVLEILNGLKKQSILSRIGAVITPNSAGVSTLAAMEVPEDRLEEVAEQVNAHPEVNHNYEREHSLNLWFVATAPAVGELAKVLEEISSETGLEVIELPLISSYHIDLGFAL